ncbi:MAG: Crp/Fnr family transcriptional regulator [Janthinobacterium lividum]
MEREDAPLKSLPPCKQACEVCGLRSNPAFLEAGASDLAAIESFRVGSRTILAGRTLLEEHIRSPQLFTLYAGWAFRFKTLTDGRRQILNFLLPGDFIGLQDEFAEGNTHGVEAATDATFCVFERDRLWELFHLQPKLGYDITWLAAREEKMMDDHLVTTGRRNASERIAMLLMHLYRRAEHIGMIADGWVAFPLNQQHIADALGLSLVHTNKTLRRLQRLGLHEIDDGRLRILEPHALETLGDYYERPLRRVPLI